MAYHAEPFDPARHQAALETLWREEFGDPRVRAHVPERMDWLYAQNPLGRATTYVTVVTETGETCACATYFPRGLVVHGEPVRGGVLCDFAVNKHNRIAGAAIAVQRGLAKSARPSGHEILFGFPNKGSVAVCKRVGYRVIGATSMWVKPLRSGYKIDVADTIPEPLKRPATRVVDAGLAAFDEALALTKLRGFESEELDAPDARFDALWARARPTRGIAAERTRDYLSWRYARFTTSKHRFHALVRRGTGELVAYAAYSIEDGRAILQDLFAEDFTRATDALLVSLARELRRRGVWSIVLSFLGPARFGERLARLGFIERAVDRVMVAYLDPGLDERLRREFLDAENWFLLDGELDI
ncbi:MAG: GNAT family N-acetyltransferase [Polyangiaceae bacterium]